MKPIRFRGRALGSAELSGIREFVRRHSGATRGELSSLICRRWGWRRPNGELRLRACRDLLQRLLDGGHLELPPPRAPRPRRRSVLTEVPAGPSLVELGERNVSLRDVRVRPVELGEVDRWRDAMERHHYLGDGEIVGESLRYVAESEGRWLAHLAWGAAVLKSRHREAFVGRDEDMEWAATEELAAEPDQEVVERLHQLALGDQRHVSYASRHILQWTGLADGSRVARIGESPQPAGDERWIPLDTLPHSDWRAARMAGERAFHQLTGRDFGYRAENLAKHRREPLEKLKAWWAENGEKSREEWLLSYFREKGFPMERLWSRDSLPILSRALESDFLTHRLAVEQVSVITGKFFTWFTDNRSHADREKMTIRVRAWLDSRGY